MNDSVCSNCGRSIDDLCVDDLPYVDPDSGRPLCTDCWFDDFQFKCCSCWNYEDVSRQHEVLVVTDEAAGVMPGIYLIKHMPYYAAPVVGHDQLYDSALHRVCDIPAGLSVDTERYPCGHLCLECRQRIPALRRTIGPRGNLVAVRPAARAALRPGEPEARTS